MVLGVLVRRSAGQSLLRNAYAAVPSRPSINPVNPIKQSDNREIEQSEAHVEPFQVTLQCASTVTWNDSVLHCHCEIVTLDHCKIESL